MDKVKLFIEETKMHVANFNIDFNVDELIVINNDIINNDLISENGFVKFAVIFAKAIAIGEVTKEIFTHNLNAFKEFLISLKENKLKEIFKSNVDPRLFMNKEEIEDKLCERFDAMLTKTEDVIKQEKQESENALHQLTSLFTGLHGNGKNEMRQFLATKKKRKKR